MAFHSEELPGRICQGEITTGVAYTLDPYRNAITVATLDGRAMAAPLRQRLEEGGVVINAQQRYRVATTDYSVQQAESFGQPDRAERSSVLLRDALVAYLRAGGLAQATA